MVVAMLSPELRYTPETSQSLLVRLGDANNHESWQLFSQIYSPVLRDYYRRRGVQDADCDDLVQDVLAIVVKSLRAAKYDRSKGRFRAWLGTVATNRLKNFFRDRASHANLMELTLDDELYIDPDSDWVELFSRHLFHVACSRIQPQFEPQTWECFSLTWMHHVPAKEVANQIGIPLHSVYVNKSRVLQRLRQEIELLAEDCAVPD